MKPTAIMPNTKAEAISIASGLYSMNATSAFAYAFTQGEKPDYGVNIGEFMYPSERDMLNRDRFDAYIDLKTGKLVIL